MKRYILSVFTLLIAATAVAPAAQALDTQTSLKRQVSTPAELSEDATFHDLIRHNRRVRNKS